MRTNVFPMHERNFKTGTNEWLTPLPIIKALGPFDLDPCSPGPARAVADRQSNDWIAHGWLVGALARARLAEPAIR